MVKSIKNKSLKVILITGTPCSGKTTLAKKLSLSICWKLIEISKFVKKCHLAEGYDKKRGSYIVDENKLSSKLKTHILMLYKNDPKNLPKGVIIEGHMAHFFPAKFSKLCIVVHCKLSTLKKRLEARGYSQAKVRENLDAEIFDICSEEAISKKHIVISVDCSTRESSQKAALKIRSFTSKLRL